MMLDRRKLLLAGILFLLLSVPLTLFVLQQRQELRQRAAGASVSLILSPESATKSVGETFEVALTLNGSDNNVSSVDVTLNFSIDVLEAVSFTPAATFGTTFRNTISNQAGTIRYTGANLTPTPITGNAIALGAAMFRAKGVGASPVTFSNIQITASGVRTALPTENNVNGSYTVSQSQGTTPSPIPTESGPTPPQPITTPTPPPTATPAPSPSPAPTGAGPTPCATCATFDVQVTLAGIGTEGNQNPRRTTRTGELGLFDVNNDQEVAVDTGSFAFDSAAGDFRGTIQVVLPSGSGTYTVKVKVDGYLRKRLPGFRVVTAGTNVTLPPIPLTYVDANNDGERNIQDYNVYVSCFGARAGTASCPNPRLADFNDDGRVDSGEDFLDYKILFQSFAVQRGD